MTDKQREAIFNMPYLAPSFAARSCFTSRTPYIGSATAYYVGPWDANNKEFPSWNSKG